MALPKTTEVEVNAAAETLAEERREQALATTSVQTPAHGIVETMSGSNPLEFLAEIGITDVKLDFTSFPIVTLDDSAFSTDEYKKFAESFEAILLDKRPSWLYSADLGRDKAPELAYSDDNIMVNRTNRTVAEQTALWDEKGIPWDVKQYIIVLALAVDGPHANEIIQLQIPPGSIGKLNGYLWMLGMRKINLRKAITKVSVGPLVGSGIKAFHPYTFKLVGTQEQ